MSKAHVPLLCAYVVVGICCATPAVAQAIWSSPLHERGAILRHPIIPTPFRGYWSERLAACGTDAVDESQAWITAGALNFYETNGHVVRVVVADARHAVVTLRDEGEGTVFTAKKGLTLSRDGKSLTMRNQDDTGSTRFFSCPRKSAS